ncbi:PAPS-dependent sulfotransferase Stf3 [Durusdinium trenchii]|uniref:PAPS-dependent sulfotransferase Stf3 n=1 Tax=Durusdinium trenchii TaxID=1381693 RepID=A0ABP0R2D0_9DINO
MSGNATVSTSVSSSSSETSTAFEIRRPFVFEMLLTAGRLAERCGMKPPSLSAEAVMAGARRRTGLDDFGPHDFSKPLELILEDYEQDPNRGLAGRIAARARTVTRMCQRLWIEDDLKRHPETCDIPITRPIFILGFPRTGTTLLQRLMARDPDNRVTYMWEMQQPALPEKLDRSGEDVRLKRAKSRLKLVTYVAPQLHKLHPMNAENPEECAALMANTLVSPAFALPARATEIGSEADPVFPDARIIHTHRDPLKVVPSGCSLATAIERLLSDKANAHAVADRYLDFAQQTIDRAMKARDAIGADRVLDMQYEEVIADPVAAVERVYSFCGLDVKPAHREEMRRWLDENTQDKHGRHRYRLEDFGLTEERIADVFGTYVDRFKIPCADSQ